MTDVVQPQRHVSVPYLPLPNPQCRREGMQTSGPVLVHRCLTYTLISSLFTHFPPSLTHFLPLSSSPSFTTAAFLNGRSDSDTNLKPTNWESASRI